MVSLTFVILIVATVSAQETAGHPCNDIPDPTSMHPCWGQSVPGQVYTPSVNLDGSERTNDSLGEHCETKSNPKKISKCYRQALIEYKAKLKPFGCGMKENDWDQVARGNCLRDLLRSVNVE